METDEAEDAAELMETNDHVDGADADDAIDPMYIVELLESADDVELLCATSSSLLAKATFSWVDTLASPLVAERALIWAR